MSKGIGPDGVVMPFERCDAGEEYCAPGPCLTRQMTPEERKKYGPPKPVPVNIQINRAKARRARLRKEGKNVESASEYVNFSVPEGKDWRDVLTRGIYVQLKKLGWSDARVMKACGSHNADFNAWKREYGLIGVRLGTNGELVMPNGAKASDKPLPPAQAANHLQAEIEEAATEFREWKPGMRVTDLATREEVEAVVHLTNAEAAKKLRLKFHTYKRLKQIYGLAQRPARESLNLQDALKTVSELEADVGCYERLLEDAQMTSGVAAAIEQCYRDAKRKLDKINNARVVI